jgi:hypothetical protein
MGEELEPYPETGFRDYARAGADAGIAAIPVIGGSLQVLAESVIAPSLTKRRDTWFRKLHELMSELHAKVDGFDPESLAGDEVFVTAVSDASRIAMGTHLEEKLDLLKNCLAHMAVDEGRDDFLDLQLFRFVDELTPEHVVVLQYLNNPGAWFDAKRIERPSLAMGSPSHLMNAAGMPVTGVALEIVLRNLNDRGLANTQSLKTTMTADGAWQSLTTELGRDLLEFVSSI